MRRVLQTFGHVDVAAGGRRQGLHAGLKRAVREREARVHAHHAAAHAVAPARGLADEIHVLLDGGAALALATMPVEDLFTLYQGRLPEGAYPRVIPWLERALAFPSITPQLKTRVLCILADCYKETGDLSKAKQCFNQAFIVSAEIDNEQMRLQLQKMIQSRLNTL